MLKYVKKEVVGNGLPSVQIEEDGYFKYIYTDNEFNKVLFSCKFRFGKDISKIGQALECDVVERPITKEEKSKIEFRKNCIKKL